MDDNNVVSSQNLSDLQQKILAILPIPSSLLSIFGSSMIIYVALLNRQRRKRSPYTRLLIALSICDIFASVNIATASFLRPKDSPRVWSFGNASTCSVSGFLTTVFLAAPFYNCMLSFYFLLTARFRLKNSFIAKRIEPIMHLIALGYPITCATIGAGLDVYADTSMSFGCWVNDYPRNCGPAPGQTGEKCLASTIGWIFFGWPYLIILTCMVVNNAIIWCFVHGQSVPIRNQQSGPTVPSSASSPSAWRMSTLFKKTASEGNHSTCSSCCLSSEDDEVSASESCDGDSFLIEDSNVDETCCLSETILPNKDDGNIQTEKGEEAPTERESPQESHQLRRLRLVKSQALLFVASYLSVVLWMGIMASIENYTDSEDDELTKLAGIYPIMILNALFSPLQGFLNMLVYLRPKYMQVRHQYKGETRFWAVKRAILGAKKAKPSKKRPIPKIPDQMPKIPDQMPIKMPSQPPEDMKGVERDDLEYSSDRPIVIPLPRDMVSTLSADQKDFDEEDSEEHSEELKGGDEYTRWGEGDNKYVESRKTWTPLKQSRRYVSRLQERGSSLGVISEMTESTFDLIIDPLESEELKQEARDEIHRLRRWNESSLVPFHGHTTTTATATTTLSPPAASPDDRWGNNSARNNQRGDRSDLSDLLLVMPHRIPSSSEIIVDEEY